MSLRASILSGVEGNLVRDPPIPGQHDEISFDSAQDRRSQWHGKFSQVIFTTILNIPFTWQNSKAVYFENKVLSQLKPGERVLYDFSITDKPDDGTFYRDDQMLNYSATYEWLSEFTDFLKDCKGFTVI